MTCNVFGGTLNPTLPSTGNLLQQAQLVSSECFVLTRTVKIKYSLLADCSSTRLPVVKVGEVRS